MINGVINVYKEKGFTSHDVVAKLRGILRQKKIGHTGTLDPDATGVLPVCLGNATRLCDMLTDKDKEYRAEILFGISTDTQDIGGEILEKTNKKVTRKEAELALQSFLGRQLQIPPMYSAVKVKGKKLYELARQGIEVERKEREVFFYELELLDFTYPKAELRIHCSKGTYIRTLCHDLGEKLGCKACMSSLKRLRVERFLLEDTYSLDQIEELVREKRLQEILYPVDSIFSSYPPLWVLEKADFMLYNGNRLKKEFCKRGWEEKEDEKFRVYDSQGNFQAIYEYRAREGAFYPLKMFLEIPLKNKEKKKEYEG